MKPVDVKSCTYIGAFKFNFDVKYLFAFLSCNMFEILFVYCLDILFPPILSFPWVADKQEIDILRHIKNVLVSGDRQYLDFICIELLRLQWHTNIVGVGEYSKHQTRRSIIFLKKWIWSTVEQLTTARGNKHVSVINDHFSNLSNYAHWSAEQHKLQWNL